MVVKVYVQHLQDVLDVGDIHVASKFFKDGMELIVREKQSNSWTRIRDSMPQHAE